MFCGIKYMSCWLEYCAIAMSKANILLPIPEREAQHVDLISTSFRIIGLSTDIRKSEEKLTAVRETSKHPYDFE